MRLCMCAQVDEGEELPQSQDEVEEEEEDSDGLPVEEEVDSEGLPEEVEEEEVGVEESEEPFEEGGERLRRRVRRMVALWEASGGEASLQRPTAPEEVLLLERLRARWHVLMEQVRHRGDRTRCMEGKGECGPFPDVVTLRRHKLVEQVWHREGGGRRGRKEGARGEPAQPGLWPYGHQPDAPRDRLAFTVAWLNVAATPCAARTADSTSLVYARAALPVYPLQLTWL